jgi:DNA-directed RNA polymerase III subunit RPC6
MDPDKLSILKNALYDACVEKLESDDEKGWQKVFSQEELQNLDVIPPKDLKTLAMVIRELTDEFLFITINTSYGAAWRLRPESEALKYHGLTQDQTLIYSLIDNAGAEGIWQQDMRKKTNMRDQTLKKVLKELENQKKLIASFTSVQQASHRCYIKASIKPSEKATGGPWFADGDLDESFIEMLLAVTHNLIKQSGTYLSLRGEAIRSASSSPVLPKKVINGSQSEAAIAARGKKRSADDMAADEDPFADSPSKSRKKSSQPVRIPMPAGYKHYLTLSEITQQLAKSGVTKGMPLKESDIQQLVDVLMYENRIEEIKIGKRLGYRPVRSAKLNTATNSMSLEDDCVEPPSNGLTTAPCGRCPVFELCEEGGPVWAGGCEYFDQWLV